MRCHSKEEIKMKYRVDKIDALLVVMLIAMDRNFIRCSLMDETADKELAVVNYNFSYEHPQVVFTPWAKKSGWTKAFNKDWYVHDAVKEVLVAEGIVPGSIKVTSPKQQQATSQAPHPQKPVSEIVRQKVKVTQAPKPQAKQEQQKEVVIPKPQKAENIVMMSDEQLAAEIHKISDFENDFVDPDLL
jgi:hypothetical protein